MRNQGLKYCIPSASTMDNKAARQFLHGDFDRLGLQVKYKIKMMNSRQRKPKTERVTVEDKYHEICWK